ncbi:butyrate kinase [Alkalibacter mobilis]|uniref:butyrate kinase n=1 Tax=Alkalibacter mobilis TaxID=2787712 RepID=UPI0018A05128|nr:butyrate kinase [Alkalibacter mobilis]MBF7095600.1 butyrate kinase [Alkalibacter mobilis]
MKILVINPGSTSTKIAVYQDEDCILSKNIEYASEEINKYPSTMMQLQMRKDSIIQTLNVEGHELGSFKAIVGRGGMLPKVKSGAYLVNETMIRRLKENPMYEHASNLGAVIAGEIAELINVDAYIYDSVRVDEMNEVARISGMPDIERTSTCHALNSRAMAIKTAKKVENRYGELNFIVAHLGGGISISVHEKGHIVDIIADDEGPFSPERCGKLPCKNLIDLCYSGQFDEKTMHKKLRGQGGLVAYLGTNDAREVEKMIAAGNEYAKIIYEAMAYQIAKGIGELSTVVKGKVDYIIITGGIAYSDMLTTWIKERVEFIAPVEIIPGEYEMEALAFGTLRVLRNEETAREYTE